MAVVRDLHTSAFFLKRDELYKTVKPYAQRDFSDNALPADNLMTQRVTGLPIKDLRGIEEQISFEKNGIAVLEMKSAMSYSDFNDANKVKNTYCNEIANVLLHYMQATLVQVFDVRVRRRHPLFPQNMPADIDLLEKGQPVGNAHIDCTPEAIRTIVEEMNGFEATKLLHGRYISVNVWKPLRGPVKDWPLALCDATSVKKSDLAPCDFVLSSDIVREMFQVHHNNEQTWYYLSDQEATELLLFRQDDSIPNLLPGTQ